MKVIKNISELPAIGTKMHWSEDCQVRYSFTHQSFAISGIHQCGGREEDRVTQKMNCMVCNVEKVIIEYKYNSMGHYSGCQCGFFFKKYAEVV